MTADKELKYNTLGPRFCALLIDGIILLLADLALRTLLRAVCQQGMGFYPEWGANGDVVHICLLISYFAISHSLYGQTIGKSWMHLKVVDMNERRYLTWSESFRRETMKLTPLLLCYVLGSSIHVSVLSSNMEWGIIGGVLSILPALDILTAFCTKKHRALHDFIGASTIIISSDTEIFPRALNQEAFSKK